MRSSASAPGIAIVGEVGVHDGAMEGEGAAKEGEEERTGRRGVRRERARVVEGVAIFLYKLLFGLFQGERWGDMYGCEADMRCIDGLRSVVALVAVGRATAFRQRKAFIVTVRGQLPFPCTSKVDVGFAGLERVL